MTHDRLSRRPRVQAVHRTARSAVLALMSSTAPLAALAAAVDAPANNITATDTRSTIAPALQAPPVAAESPPIVFLEAARTALNGGRTGETQEALERAEARLLSRAVDPADAATPDTQREVNDIGAARRALAVRDRSGAARAINDAILAANQPAAPYRPTPVALAPSAVVVAPPPPPVPPLLTYTLLPGHWQLHGATYVWVPPETRLRRVEDRPFVQGRYVWRDGSWVWMPGHYSGS
jgi:hypothetical protein